MVELTDAYIESNTGVEGKFGEVVGRVQTPSHMSYYKPMEPNGAAKTVGLPGTNPIDRPAWVVLRLVTGTKPINRRAGVGYM